MSFMPQIAQLEGDGVAMEEFTLNEIKNVNVPFDMNEVIRPEERDKYKTMLTIPMCPAERVMLYDENERASPIALADLSLQRCMVQGIETRNMSSGAPFPIQAQIGHKMNSARSCMRHGDAYSFLIPSNCNGLPAESHFDQVAARAQLEFLAKYGHLDRDKLLGRCNPDKEKANACTDRLVVEATRPGMVMLHVTHPIAAIITKRTCNVDADGNFSIKSAEDYAALQTMYSPADLTFKLPLTSFLKEVDDLDKHVLQELRTDSLTNISLKLQRSKEDGAKMVVTDPVTGIKSFGPTFTRADHPAFGDFVGYSNPHGLAPSRLVSEHTCYRVSSHVSLKMAVLFTNKVGIPASSLQTLEAVARNYYALYPASDMTT